MKKKSIIMFAVLAAFFLSACDHISTSTVETAGTVIEVSSVSTDEAGSVDSASSFEQVNETSASGSITSRAPVSDLEVQKEQSTAVSKPADSESSSSQIPQKTQPPKQTEAPKQPETVESSKSVSTQEPTPEPVYESKTEPAVPAFDVSQYVSYAKNYGTRIGLKLDSAAVSCWDDPLSANSKCSYLERDIRDRLEWYKISGFSAFCVWTEDLGSGNYRIFIGYA